MHSCVQRLRFQPTNFELFACHEDLCIRDDGRWQAELQPVRCVGRDRDTEGGQTKIKASLGRNGPTWDHQLTLIVDVEEPALLVVATETYQHLIGRAAGRLVGLPVSEDSQFPGRLLRAVPEGVRKQGL